MELNFTQLLFFVVIILPQRHQDTKVIFIILYSCLGAFVANIFGSGLSGLGGNMRKLHKIFFIVQGDLGCGTYNAVNI